MRHSLLAWRAGDKTEDEVNTILDDVIELLTKWHNVFHILQAKQRKKGMKKDLSNAIKLALAKHREMGLTITHKAHLIEDHVIKQFVELPFAFFYLIEEFVEQNHQTGHKFEEQVKRIKNDQSRAFCKARQIWVSRNKNVQRYINRVHKAGERKQYKKRKQSVAVAITPPVYRPTPPLLSVASTASQSAVAPPSERDLCALEDRLVSSAVDYSPPAKRQRTVGAPTYNSCGD
jgi:hypothetical protein